MENEHKGKEEERGGEKKGKEEGTRYQAHRSKKKK